MRRHPACESLERRDCPTLAALPTLVDLPSFGVVPYERTDAEAVRLHRHDLAVAASGRADVVVLGDSITYKWANEQGKASWRAGLAPLGASAFGVPEDTAQALLWRVEDGELAGHPKVVVVEVGTNNLGDGESPDEAVAAIAGVVDAIRAESPSTRVLLLGLLPRGKSPSDPLRAEVAAVNAQLPEMADGQDVVYFDPGPFLTRADGSITPFFQATGGYVHPNAAGYRVLTDAITGTVASLLAQG